MHTNECSLVIAIMLLVWNVLSEKDPNQKVFYESNLNFEENFCTDLH